MKPAIRKLKFEKKVNNIFVVRNFCKERDFAGTGMVDATKFEEVLKAFGLEVSKDDIKAIYQHHEGWSGGMKYNDWCDSLADHNLSKAKADIIARLWALLDPKKTGEAVG